MTKPLLMNTITLPCQLLCASASAYAIFPKDKSGNYNPTEKLVNGKWVPDPAKKQYVQQYQAIGFIGNPWVVTAAEIEAALVGKTANGIVIAFRGTLAPALNWDSFLDWLQDFMLPTQSNINLPGKVHEGFLIALTLLNKGIATAVKALDPTGKLPVYVTGHSKGGGIAPIAAMYFKNVYKFPIRQTITFAGPNSGNADFARAYNAAFPNHIRYENYLDIIPLMPPDAEFVAILDRIPFIPKVIIDLMNKIGSYGYEPVGNLMYIDSKAVAKAYNKIEANVLLPLRMAEIGATLLRGDLAAIADAHHASCGYRYMKGTCLGTVCK